MWPCTTATPASALASRNSSGVTGAESSVTSCPSAASTFRISRKRIPIPAGWLFPSGSGQTSMTRLIVLSPALHLLDDRMQLPRLRRIDHVQHRLEPSHLGIQRLHGRLRLVERAPNVAVCL